MVLGLLYCIHHHFFIVCTFNKVDFFLQRNFSDLFYAVGRTPGIQASVIAVALDQLRILLLISLSKKVEPFAPTPREELMKIWNEVLSVLDWAHRFLTAPNDLVREFCTQALIWTFPPFEINNLDDLEGSETYVSVTKTGVFFSYIAYIFRFFLFLLKYFRSRTPRNLSPEMRTLTTRALFRRWPLPLTS